MATNATTAVTPGPVVTFHKVITYHLKQPKYRGASVYMLVEPHNLNIFHIPFPGRENTVDTSCPRYLITNKSSIYCCVTKRFMPSISVLTFLIRRSKCRFFDKKFLELSKFQPLCRVCPTIRSVVMCRHSPNVDETNPFTTKGASGIPFILTNEDK